MSHMAMLQYKNPCPRGHRIINFGSPFLLIITIYIVCENMPRSKEEDISRNTSMFHFFLFNYLLLRFGWRVIKFTIPCLLTLQMLHTKFGQDRSLVVIQKKMLSHDARRKTTGVLLPRRGHVSHIVKMHYFLKNIFISTPRHGSDKLYIY